MSSTPSPLIPPTIQILTPTSINTPLIMMTSSYKRSFDELSGFSAFHFPRNVRARLYSRHHFVIAPPQVYFRPILKTKTSQRATFATNAKENRPNDSNHQRQGLDCEKSSQQSRTTRIRFHQKVAVHCIPARDQYPEEVKKCMWSDMSEIREMARRNTIEFASEGYDWRRCTEDDAMVLSPTGERVHPVWEQRRHFMPSRSKRIRISRSAEV